jgi:hypothetical protein
VRPAIRKWGSSSAPPNAVAAAPLQRELEQHLRPRPTRARPRPPTQAGAAPATSSKTAAAGPSSPRGRAVRARPTSPKAAATSSKTAVAGPSSLRCRAVCARRRPLPRRRAARAHPAAPLLFLPDLPLFLVGTDFRSPFGDRCLRPPFFFLIWYCRRPLQRNGSPVLDLVNKPVDTKLTWHKPAAGVGLALFAQLRRKVTTELPSPIL